MKNNKFKTFIILMVLVMALAIPAYVLGVGGVSYKGQTDGIVFEPGTDESPTDLFAEFKNVMPGDTLTDTVEVRNDNPDGKAVKVYMKALGADEGSEDFLSQLTLDVEQVGGSKLFEATADQKTGLEDWTLLGTIDKGGKQTLNVKLGVPIELGNDYQSDMGTFKWQFKAEEIDPPAPKEYKVSYKYESETPGKDLPEAVMNTLPSDDGTYPDKTEVEAKDPSATEVKVDGGKWMFGGWIAASKIINGADIEFVGTWKFDADVIPGDDPEPKRYKVSYKYESETPGRDLPEAVMNTLPSDDGTYPDGTEVEAKDPSATEVKVDGGKWMFGGWIAASKTINGGDIEFVGTWKFDADVIPGDDPTDDPVDDQTDDEITDGSTDDTPTGTSKDKKTSTVTKTVKKLVSAATGDNAAVTLGIVLLVLSAAVVAATVRRRKN